MKMRRALAIGLLLVAFGAMAAVFIQVIWIPLYRNRDAPSSAERPEESPSPIEVERKEGTGTRSWSVADQQAISRLKAGLRSADYGAPAEPPAPDQTYRVRIRRPDSRIDEVDVILGSEGLMHDRFYVVRRTGGTSVYGTVFNTPELREALQKMLVPPAPK